MIKNFCGGMFKNGHGQSGHGTLKLTVSWEWKDQTNWFFACWCKFKKAKSYFNDFRVGMVKNEHGQLVHETLNSVVSWKWVYELSWFFACWLWRNNFWLDGHRTLYLWLLNQSTAVVLVGPPAIAEMVLWNRVCPSFCCTVCPGVFFELDH